MKLACAAIIAALLVFTGLIWWADIHISPWLLILTLGWSFASGGLAVLTYLDAEE